MPRAAITHLNLETKGGTQTVDNLNLQREKKTLEIRVRLKVFQSLFYTSPGALSFLGALG